MRYFFGILLVLAGIVWAYFAVPTVVRQHERISTFVASPAVILSSEVEIKRGRKSTSYRPNIRYTYQAGGRVWESSTVTAFHETGNSAWANEIVARYPAKVIRRALSERNMEKEANAVAYVNPNDPGDAILVREYSFSPYMLSILPFAMVMVGMMMVLGFISGGRSNMMAVAVDASGWKLLLPRFEIRKIFVSRLVMLIAFVILGATLPLHYVMVTDRVRMWAGIFLAVLAGMTLLSAVLAIRARQVHRRVSDARLQVNPAPAVLGQTLKVSVELDAYQGLQLEAVEVSLVCTETRKSNSKKNQTVTAEILRRMMKVAGETSLSPGQVISGEGQIEMDRIWPETSGRGAPLPRHAWKLEVKAKLRGVADYQGEFPLDVVRG